MATRHKILRQNDRYFVLAKELAAGPLGVGLFNLDDRPANIVVSWTELGIIGKQEIHDLWRQKDLGKSKEHYQVEVPRHGVAFLKITPKY